MESRRIHIVRFLALFLPLIPATVYGQALSSLAFSQAVSLFQAKNYGQASMLLKQVLQADPTNYQAYYYLGTCQGQMGTTRTRP